MCWNLDQHEVPPLRSFVFVQFRPQATLTIAAITKISAAELDNLQVKDTIIAVNAETISDCQQFVNLITQSANKSLQFCVNRQDSINSVTVTPKSRINDHCIEQVFL
ncbi:PDZ domain-containing protein [Pseudoalteromonas sp. S1731]|uniref:PDZ domain-containing protein n=1 Tax=Pseudoalteromonas sp. S1731 TaxID=579515 RepID=UPI002017AF07|nr:PDZ domain-containing protein [Pseudoalteromonas sp. S1731]